MENERNLIPMTQLLGALNERCIAKDTGAFFVASEEGHWGEFLLVDGEIVNVRYRNKRGADALAVLRSVTRAKFSFTPGGFKAVQAPAADRLPTTRELLGYLARGAREASAPAPAHAQVAPAITQATPGVAGARPQPAAPRPRPVAPAAATTAAQAAAPGAAPRPAAVGAGGTPSGAAPVSRPGLPPRMPVPRGRPTAPAATGAPGVPAAPIERKVLSPIQPAREAPKLRQKIILVVEDSAVSRKVITNTLDQKGYKLVEAADGFEALAQLGNEMPDLVILDLILPGMDGYKVMSHMKKKPSFANIPIIVLTSRDSLMDKLRGKMSGTDEYLTKPFSSIELLEKVGKYLNET